MSNKPKISIEKALLHCLKELNNFHKEHLIDIDLYILFDSESEIRRFITGYPEDPHDVADLERFLVLFFDRVQDEYNRDFVLIFKSKSNKILESRFDLSSE